MKQCHQNYCDDIPEQHRRVHYTRTLAALLQAMTNMHEFEHGLMYYNERIKKKASLTLINFAQEDLKPHSCLFLKVPRVAGQLIL